MQRSKGPTLQNENIHTRTENMLGNRLWNEENEKFVVALLDCQTTIFEAACNTNTFVEAIGWQQFAQANWNEKCIFRVFLTVFLVSHSQQRAFSHGKILQKVCLFGCNSFFISILKKAGTVKKISCINIEHSIIWSFFLYSDKCWIRSSSFWLNLTLSWITLKDPWMR